MQQVADSITPNTRLAVLDHIASTTGFVLPLEKLIPVFHAKGIPVLVDGASAPGQLPLNLRTLGADFYVGTCYKWLFGSKSCSFLYVNKSYQVSSAFVCFVVVVLRGYFYLLIVVTHMHAYTL